MEAEALIGGWNLVEVRDRFNGFTSRHGASRHPSRPHFTRHTLCCKILAIHDKIRLYWIRIHLKTFPFIYFLPDSNLIAATMSDYEDEMDVDGPPPANDIVFTTESNKGKRSTANLPVEAEDSLPWCV